MNIKELVKEELFKDSMVKLEEKSRIVYNYTVLKPFADGVIDLLKYVQYESGWVFGGNPDRSFFTLIGVEYYENAMEEALKRWGFYRLCLTDINRYVIFRVAEDGRPTIAISSSVSEVDSEVFYDLNTALRALTRMIIDKKINKL